MSHREEFLKSCLVLDTETTSDDYNIAEIIELGFGVKEKGSWEIFQGLYKPDLPISPIVQAICYITNEMVADKQRFLDAVNNGFNEIIDNFEYMIAHNYFYDKKVLKNHGVDTKDKKWICTWRMAKKLFNGDETVEQTKLPYLRFRFALNVPIELHCHRAGNDALVTAKLLEFCLDIMERDGIIDKDEPYGPQIYNWLNDPIIYKLMPIGKYKNWKMEDVPIDYWNWALNNMDSLNENADNYDPDFAASVMAVIEKKLNS